MVVFVAVGAVATPLWYLSSYVDLVPIVLHRDRLVDAPEIRSPAFDREFASVASEFGYQVRITGDRPPQIHRTLAMSRETLWMLTSKTLDAMHRAPGPDGGAP